MKNSLHRTIEEVAEIDSEIKKLKKEMGTDFCEESRMAFLERRIPELREYIDSYTKSAKIFHAAINLTKKDSDKEINEFLSKEKREYFNLYTEYAEIKNPKSVKPQEGFTKQQIEQAASTPIALLLVNRKIINAGGKIKTHCPFHEERTPSFVVFKENSYHCFGCGAHGGDAINYVQAIDQRSFKEAVEYLLHFHAAGISVQ